MGLGRLLLITLWLGAALFFTLAVAPSAFAALPTRELAGALVGRVLPTLFWSGAAAGGVLAAAELVAPSRRHRTARLAAAAVIVVACLAAQLLVAPRIAELRAGMQVPLESLPAADPRRVAFGRLHVASVAWLGLAMTSGLMVLILAALSLPRDDRP